MKKYIRVLTCMAVLSVLVMFLAVPAFATGGDVSGAIKGTWEAAQSGACT